MATKNKLADKQENIRSLITDAIKILSDVGLPIEHKKGRSLEMMAMAFLAVAGIKKIMERG